MKYRNKIKSLFASKISKTIFGMGILAISIVAISKKVISYPAKGCIKGTQELTFKNFVNLIVSLVLSDVTIRSLGLYKWELLSTFGEVRITNSRL